MNSLSELPILEYKDGHWPEIDAFWSMLLGSGWNERSKARWQWLNKHRTHFLVRDRGRILGNATLLRQSFISTEGSSLDLGWITDFYVSPELKGRGIGKRLTNHLAQQAGVLATFGQSEAARHCFSSLGWTAPTWIPLLAKTLPLAFSSQAEEREISQVDAADPRITEIWTRRAQTKAAMGVRDADHLACRLQGRPDAKYETWLACDSQRPVGWIVTRIIRGNRNRMFGWVPVGLVVDVFAAGEEPRVLGDLIRFGARRLARQGAAVVLAVETVGATGAALRECDFRQSIGLGPFSLRPLPAKGLMLAPGGTERLGTRLHLSFLDCDAELTF
jgi:GNAT superfamily N-acetyltransferase